MTIKYNLWLHIEKEDEESDIYEDTDRLPEKLGVFNNEAAAIEAAKLIKEHDWEDMVWCPGDDDDELIDSYAQRQNQIWNELGDKVVGDE